MRTSTRPIPSKRQFGASLAAAAILIFFPCGHGFFLPPPTGPCNPATLTPQNTCYQTCAPSRSHRRTGMTAASYNDKLDVDSIYLDDVQRIFVLSDLHTDSAQNMQWLRKRCTSTSICTSNSTTTHPTSTPGPNDAIIIAGDISHDLDIVRETFSIILEHWKCHLFFVGGNHEAWVGGSKMDAQNLKCSINKLHKVVDLCHEMGVHTSAKLIGRNDVSPVWILPMWSWYDGTLALEGCEDLSQGLDRWPWVDFTRCQWSEKYRNAFNNEDARADPRYQIAGFERIPSPSLTDHFLMDWSGPQMDVIRRNDDAFINRNMPGLISYTHFVPNQQCLPDWKDPATETFDRHGWLDHPVPEVSAKFAYVAGSDRIDQEIRSFLDNPAIRSQIHVFGHSHRPKDFDMDGVRYIHHPLGKPVEREMHMIEDGETLDFKLIWDTRSEEGEVRGERIVRYWEDYGGGVELLAENMEKRRQLRKRRSRVQ